jgi:hypothetical protein
MRISRKIATLALSVAMLATQVIPVYATNASLDPNTGTDEVEGHMLADNVESVVVPTTLKLALNPNNYDILTRYQLVDQTAVAAPVSGTQYYTYNSSNSKYEKVASTVTSWEADTDYFTAVTSNASVVSLNYGIANKSSRAKVVKVDFALSYVIDANSGTQQPIDFVATKKEAQVKSDSNADGAVADEYKMFLAIAPSQALPTLNAKTSYEYTTDTTTASSSKTYYKKNTAGTAFEAVDSGDLDDEEIKDYFEKTDAISSQVTTADLADVKMTADETTGIVGFERKTATTASAVLAYKLDKAVRKAKPGETFDWDTTQAQVAGKLRLEQIGGVAGYTITGAINPNADWTQVSVASIKIKPTYTIREVDGSEEAVSATTGAAYNQIKLSEKPKVTTTDFAILEEDAPVNISVSLGLGAAKANKVDQVNLVPASGAKVDMITGGNATYANGVVTLTAASANWLLTNTGDKIEIVFDDQDSTSVVITLTAKP